MPDGTKRVFVLMPFTADFDDVYMVIRDACSDREFDVAISCQRADDIEKPGRITDQIIESIRNADAIVADITGSNPNVMYELGYADATGIPTLILNQSVQDSPFDVASMRQVVYDRSRLVKDCRPRLVSGLSAILTDSGGQATATPSSEGSRLPGNTVRQSQSPLHVTDKLIMELQTLHLQLEVARGASDTDEQMRLAEDLLALADRIALTENPDGQDLKNLAAVLGNCGVELELAELFQQAEDVWKRAIGLVPDYPGIRYQYSDFLVDRGRLTDATAEMQRARELNPTDARLQHLETKMALARGADPDAAKKLEELWQQDKADVRSATAYLLYLQRSGDAKEFERICGEWEAALPDGDKSLAKRALADHYARGDDLEGARELYLQLLDFGDSNDQAAVHHNLATIATRSNEEAEAEKSWTLAYRMLPGDPQIRAAFSQFLSRQKRLADAVKVAAGEPLDESEDS